MFIRCMLSFIVLCLTSAAYASNSGVTYQGRILKPDGSPLSGQFTQFKMQIRTPDSAACLMYEELQSQDLRNSGGTFSLTMNDGTGSRIDTTGLTLDRIFANRGTFTLDPSSCNTGSGSYAPAAGDGRNLVVLFKDETMATWEPVPPQKINFVPLAFESKQIAGFTADSLLRVVNGSGDPLTGLAPLSNAQYTALMALVNGSSTAYTKAGELGGVALPAMNSGEALGWNGTAWVSSPVGTPGANSITSTMLQSGAVTAAKLDPAISILTSGSVGAAITTTRDFKIYAASPSTFYVGMLAPALAGSYTLTWPLTAGTSNQVLTTDGSGNLSWTTPSSAGITALTGDVTASGPGSAAATVASVGGSTAALVHSAELAANAATSANTVSTLVKRDGSGGFSAGAVSQSSAVYRDSALNTVTVQAPTTVSTSYVLKWPTAAGSVSQVLTTDAVGNLSWTSPLSASSAFVQGGNTFGAIADLGTNDNFDLRLRANGATALTILPSGLVGIGTTAPQEKLHVDATDSTVYAATSGTQNFPWTSGTGATAVVYNHSATNGAGAYLAFNAKNSSNTTDIAYMGAISNSGSLTPDIVIGQRTANPGYAERMRINAAGNVGIGTAAPQALLHVNGTASASNLWVTGASADAGTSLSMWTDTANPFVSSLAGYTLSLNTGLNNARTSRLYITNGGNVGIGTTSPVSNLVVSGGVNGLVESRVVNTTAGAAARTRIAVENSTGSVLLMGINSSTYTPSGHNKANGSIIAADGSGGLSVSANNATGDLRLYSGGSADANERVRIVSSGNVGIGTTSPAYNLDVVGDVNVTGNFKVNGVNVAAGGGDFLKDGSVAMTGALKIADGTAGAPSFAYSSDLDTGIYHSAADRVTFASGGAKSFEILGSSNGYITGGRGRFSVGTPGSPTFGFENDTSTGMYGGGGTLGFAVAGTAIQHITAAGNVGVGTTAPNAKFDVKGPIVMSGSSSGYAGFQPAAAAGSTIWTLPSADGTSNQVLTTNGSGLLSWSTPSAGGIAALTGDVTASGSGSVAATVAAVGTSTAAQVHSAELLANAATAANTIDTIVKRDASGAFVTSSAKFTSSMILKDGAVGGEISIATPTGFTSYTLTLPTTDGNNGEVLTTNGSGLLSWGAAASASPWTTQAPGINYMGGLVGIGTTAPQYLLNVFADASSVGITTDGANGTSEATLTLQTKGTSWLGDTGTKGWLWKASGDLNAQVAARNDLVLGYYSGTAWRYPVWIESTGSRMTLLGQTSPSVYDIAIGGGSAKTIGVEPNSSADTGQNLSIRGGFPGSGVSDSDGGTLFLSGGNSRGTGSSKIEFQTAAPGTTGSALQTATTKMVLTSDGYIGLGTSTPLYPLDVVGTTWPGARITSGQTGNGVKDTLVIQGQNGGASGGVGLGTRILMKLENSANSLRNAAGLASVWTDATNNAESSDLYFETTSGGVGSEKVRITSAGNVGIGTTAPSAKLAVDLQTPNLVAVGGLSSVTGNPSVDGFISTVPVSRYTGLSGQTLIDDSNTKNVGRMVGVYGLAERDGNGHTDQMFGGYFETYAWTNTTDESTAVYASAYADNVQTKMTGGYFEAGSGDPGVSETIGIDVAAGGWASTTNAYGTRVWASGGGAGNQNVYGGFYQIDGANNGYGIYIDQSTGTTKPWGIYQAGSTDNNYFAGNVGIGTTSPGEKLEVNGSVKALSFITASDRRLKSHIRNIEGYEFIKRLQGVRYVLNSTQTEELGLIAQDVEKVFPEAVVTNAETGMKGVKYQALISPIIESVKDTYRMCEDRTTALRSRVETLETENSQLKKRLSQLESKMADIEKALARLPASKTSAK